MATTRPRVGLKPVRKRSSLPTVKVSVMMALMMAVMMTSSRCSGRAWLPRLGGKSRLPLVRWVWVVYQLCGTPASGKPNTDDTTVTACPRWRPKAYTFLHHAQHTRCRCGAGLMNGALGGDECAACECMMAYEGGGWAGEVLHVTPLFLIARLGPHCQGVPCVCAGGRGWG